MSLPSLPASPSLPFDVALVDSALTEADRLMMLRLLATGTVTEAQAEEVIAIHGRHGSPLLSILLALRYIAPREYARHFAELTETGYASGVLDTPEFECDEEFVAQFDPAELVRFLFCPIRRVDDMVIVIAVDPGEPQIRTIIGRVAPGADVVPLAVTEYDITRRVDQLFRARLLDTAVNALRMQRPELSASRVFTAPQVTVFAAAGTLLAAALFIVPWGTLSALIVGVNVFYLLAIAYKFVIGVAAPSVRRSEAGDPSRDINPADLPVYSILVPVYREPEVVPTLLQALARLDYPPEKLDVLILLEEGDTETIAQAKAAHPPSFFRFIYIPKSQPQTKPKACNYGLSFCRGEFVTIYDAEDIPEPNQLKRAVHAFRNGSRDLVCVQAALNYFNSRDNYLTRMFTLEYSYWFDYMLPGLDRLGLPIPLGGTSNHFVLSRLRQLGAWDPFNVTEDADLGIRATVENYRVGVIQSTTYEEANGNTRNWIRQRSRWIKGYMQTWLVHNRRPLALLRTIGPIRWLSYQFFIGGTCLTFLANPLVWLLFVASLLTPHAWTERLLGGWLHDVALASFVGGNVLAIAQGMIAVCRRRLYGLLPYAVTMPLYWCLHSIAAYMALWQLFTKPFYWEKTVHGLTKVDAHGMFKLRGVFGT